MGVHELKSVDAWRARAGTAVAATPTAEEVAAMEDSNAKETLRAFPGAAGAYDLVPLASASAVFSLDTSTDILLLHSLQVPSPPAHRPPTPKIHTQLDMFSKIQTQQNRTPHATSLHTGGTLHRIATQVIQWAQKACNFVGYVGA